MSVSLGAHGVVVVLADEHHGERPELGQVEGLADLALVGRPVAVEGKVDSAISAVLVSEGNAGPERNLSSNYPIAAIEVPGVHVHTASLPCNRTVRPVISGDSLSTLTSHHPTLLPRELRQDPEDGDTQGVGEAMGPVGSDDGVRGPQSRHYAGVHGLLARAEVAETSDGLLFVEIGGGCLQSPDGHHLLVDLQSLLPGEAGGGWWPLIHSVQLVVG